MATKPRIPKPIANAPQSKRAQALREEHAMVVREKIQTTQLVDLLQDYALGKSRVKMTPQKLKAIEMLLAKSVPDLASIKHEVSTKTVTFNIDTEYHEPDPEPKQIDQ